MRRLRLFSVVASAFFVSASLLSGCGGSSSDPSPTSAQHIFTNSPQPWEYRLSPQVMVSFGAPNVAVG